MLSSAASAAASPSAASAVGQPPGRPGRAEVAETVREYWHRYGEALCTRRVHGCQKPRGVPLLPHLLTTLHTLRDIANSLYGTRVDGVTVPEMDLKVHLSDVVHATTLGVFTTGGLAVVPKIKATETRAQHVMRRTVEDALAMLAAREEEGAAANSRLVLFVAHDRHVHRPAGQRRAPKGAGRARRGAGIVVSAPGSVALVAALDLALEGVGRVAVR